LRRYPNKLSRFSEEIPDSVFADISNNPIANQGTFGTIHRDEGFTFDEGQLVLALVEYRSA
jgi:hypothetical protein